MRSDIEFLEHIFDQMKEAGLVGSKGEFSQALLGKGASYLTSMAARDRSVPMEVLDFMSRRLFERADQSGTEIAEMEAKLRDVLAKANREADISRKFEEFRRHRLEAELGGGEVANAYPAHQTTAWRFVGTMLRRLRLDITVHGKKWESAQTSSASYRPFH